MEFKELSFEQTQIRIIDGDRGKNYPKKSDLRQRGHTLFLNNKNIINNYLDDSFGEYISEEKSNLLRKGKLERGDLVISTRGSIGNVGYYSSDIRTENIRINSGMLIIRNFDNSIDTEYLYVLMRSNFMKQRYKERISGSVQNQLPIRDFKKIKIPIPDLHSQIIIKNVILTLDSKIEINNKIISNLESQAQAIFKSWFVDFEPFQDGNFVESELGMIPEGWEVKKVNEICDLKIGRTPPRKESEWFSLKEGVKWVSIKDLGLSQMYISEVTEYLTEESIEKFNIPIVEENTLLLSFKLTVGRIAITTEKMCTNEAIAQFKDPLISTLFLFYYFKNFKFETLGNTSSIGNAVNSKIIKNIEVLVPPEKIVLKVMKMIEPLSICIRKLLNQNTKLAELRDALLPKLMAGEIDVSNIKIEGEEVKNE